ncbi:polyprenol phosphomannose-dependent alpha 1,6 mannosyltransferase MptB [Micrococcus porci]|uniref:polyprenol phosphomannose-dependent alpha 1,6 mannosyltransferase MptB n=1 Tax=Micrococcus porci TaxID=2856555 RepID=UPI003CF7804F
MGVPAAGPSGSTAFRPEYIGVGGLRADPQVAGRPLWPILVGLLGSLMLVAGSFSVGWLASASPINRWQWLIPWRTQESGVMTGTVLLTLGCWVMFWAWLRLGQTVRPFGRGALRTVNVATALWCLPMVFALPIFSRDIFAYVGQGRLMVNGQDPYTDAISSLNNWFQLGADATWADSETPYGPVFLWIEEAVVRISGDMNPDLAIFLFRLVAVVGVVLTMVFVPLLARRLSVNGAWAQWVSAANPLFTVSFVASGHNDALMVGLALAGTWCALRAGHPRGGQSTAAHVGWGVAAVVLVTASLGVKPITLVLLPFIGLLWAGPRAGWARKFVYWAATGGLSLALMVLVGRLNGFGFGWLEVMAGTGSGTSPWAPVGMMSIATRVLMEVLQLGADLQAIEGFYKSVCRLLSVLIVLALMFLGRQDRVFTRMTWAFTTLVVLSPIVQPWYLLWLLPFFAVIGLRDNWQIKWVVFTVGYFLAFGAMDQLFTWQFLDIAEEVRAASLLVSGVSLVWILAVDRKTSRFIKDHWHVRPALREGVRRLRRRPTGGAAAPHTRPHPVERLGASGSEDAAARGAR